MDVIERYAIDVIPCAATDRVDGRCNSVSVA
jgi:hypothetical protein